MVLRSYAQNWGSPLSTATSWNDAVISQGFLLGQLQKKTWESAYPSVPASNWKTDVLEFLRMLIICCSCSRYFLRMHLLDQYAHLKKYGPKHFANIRTQTVIEYKSTELNHSELSFFLQNRVDLATQRLCTRFWTPRKQTNKCRRLFIAKLTLTLYLFGCLKHCSQLVVLFLQGFLLPNAST